MRISFLLFVLQLIKTEEKQTFVYIHRYLKLHSTPFVVAIPKNIPKPILPYWLDYPPLLRPGVARGFPRTGSDERKCLTVYSRGGVGGKGGWRENSSSGSPPPTSADRSRGFRLYQSGANSWSERLCCKNTYTFCYTAVSSGNMLT